MHLCLLSSFVRFWWYRCCKGADFATANHMCWVLFHGQDLAMAVLALLWRSLIVLLQRLKAALSQQSPSGHSVGVMAMGSSPMVPQRVEQSQLLVQQPDAPSPAQPQVPRLSRLNQLIGVSLQLGMSANVIWLVLLILVVLLSVQLVQVHSTENSTQGLPLIVWQILCKLSPARNIVASLKQPWVTFSFPVS